MKTLLAKVARLRSYLGWMLQEWHERGLEFYVAGITIINARQTLFQDENGKPLAPFLSNAMNALTDNQPAWMLILAVMGCVHMGVVVLSFGRDWFKIRAVVCMIQAALYVAISTAILIGTAPKPVSERYFFTAWIAFWVAVAIGSQAASKERKAREVQQIAEAVKSDVLAGLKNG